MRLREYITENNNEYDLYSKAINDVFKLCYPFIKEIIPKKPDSTPNLMYSGRNRTDDYFVGTVRSGRSPRDMNKIVHNIIDDALYKKFGFHARSNALFCTGDVYKAYYYGRAYIIFPIGNYKYIWNPTVNDLYNKFISIGKDDVVSVHEVEQYTQYLMRTYKDTNIIKALETGNEIMLWTKKYFAFYNDKYIKFFSSYFYLFGHQKPDTEKINTAINTINEI